LGEETLSEMNLLVVTWTAFPPTRGSAVIIDNLLKEFNPKSTVLCGEHTFGGELENYDRPKYTFYLLKHPFHTGFKGSRYFKWLAMRSVIDQLKSIVRQHEIEVILGVFPDEFYTFAGSRVAKEFGIPFYSWFHNTYYDNRKGLLKFLAKFIQPRIFGRSEKIFTMSQGMNDFFMEKYPLYKTKFIPLYHGFEVPIVTVSRNVDLRSPVRFLLTGNINKSNADATERIAKAVLKQSSTNELHIYGGNKKEEWTAMGISGDRVFVHGFIPLSELTKKFEEYDVMLLPHGFDGNLGTAEYRTIFPTRTIPLLYSGKPILAHVPKNTAIHKMLRESCSAFVIDERSVDTIINGIDELLSSSLLRSRLVENASVACREYDVVHIAKRLKEQIFR